MGFSKSIDRHSNFLMIARDYTVTLISSIIQGRTLGGMSQHDAVRWFRSADQDSEVVLSPTDFTSLTSRDSTEDMDQEKESESSPLAVNNKISGESCYLAVGA